MSFNDFPPNNGQDKMMSEINVTPMVDVMLVLLIIFMVAAPMLTQGLEVELPKVDTSAIRTKDDKHTVITIDASNQIFLDEYKLGNIENLDAQVKQLMKTKGSTTIFLKADKNALYSEVAGVMGALRTAGITNIGLVTEPIDKSAK